MHRLTPALAVLPLALLAGCSGGSSSGTKTVTVSVTPSSSPSGVQSEPGAGVTEGGSTSPQSAASSTVIDPKTIVAKIPGCELEPDATVSYDMQGSQYVDCTIDPSSPNSISVTVRTNTHTPGRMAGHVTPSMQYVTGPTWLVQMQASTPTWPVTPQKVAQVLGGTVPQSGDDLPE